MWPSLTDDGLLDEINQKLVEAARLAEKRKAQPSAGAIDSQSVKTTESGGIRGYITNLPMEPDWVVRFYNQRGTAEQHIKEGKYAFHWTRLSCRKGVFCAAAM